MTPKQLFTLAKESIESFGKHKDPQLAAALSYYTIFSLAPMLVIAIAIAGLIFGEKAARNEIVTQISGTVGSDAANLIQTMIQNVNSPGAGILATVLGVFTLLASAAGAFGQIKGSLNTIWNVEPQPGPGGLKGILVGIRSQLLSFGMVLLTGLLLLVSLGLSAVLASVAQFTGDRLPIPVGVWELVNFVASLGVLMVMFAAIYKVLPDIKIAWRDVWLGAGVTSVLFVISKWLIGLYLGHTANASAYGAAGALVILLLWIYYSAHIFFLGAEFTQIYAHSHGSIRSGRRAEPVSAPNASKASVPAVGKPTAPAAPARPETVHAVVDSSIERQGPKAVSAQVSQNRLNRIEHLFGILTPLLLIGTRLFILVNQMRAVYKRQKDRASFR